MFTKDDVLRLAPDVGSAKSGQQLAHPQKWLLIQSDERALWGECQGSGSKPYRVQVDLTEPAFKCSCPSRKFPCKHGLGLMLILASTPRAVAKAECPAWVSEWLASREARATKAIERQSSPPKPRDAAAQMKRREKRIERAQAGMSELGIWIGDLLRSGLAGMPTKGFDFFDSVARRLVDAQAPGAARLVRNLGSLAAQGAGWQTPFLEQLSLLHLLVKAVDRFDELSESLRADVEAVVGIITTAEDLGALAPTSDRWQVLAQTVELEDRLRVQRTWLFGINTRRSAMLLQFAHGDSPFGATLLPGTEFDGELVYFPGSGRRASVRSQSAIEPLSSLAGLDSLAALLDQYSDCLGSFPWLESLCLPLCGVTPTRVGENSWLGIDSVGDALALAGRDEALFSLLATSGGTPVDVAAEYDGRALRPLAVVSGGRWMSLALAPAGVC